eukprot:12936830-Prorocentrum_lima.AAC.1
MQVLVLKGDVEASLQEPELTNSEDEWEWRGSRLTRHHRRPRRKTFHPDLTSSELSQFEVEPSKTMYYKEVKADQSKKRRLVWNMVDHDLTPPKDMGFWWIGST